MLPQWVGAGRLDLSAPTRFLGPRRLIKEGQLSKAKGSKRLTCILTNDILVLTEPSRNLYRMPLPLGEFVLKCVPPALPSRSGLRTLTRGPSREYANSPTMFQIVPRYRGDPIVLRASSAKEAHEWYEASLRSFSHASG